MIELDTVYNLITQAFHKSESFFEWTEKKRAIIQGSLEHLPWSDDLNEFNAGDYFALVDIREITIEDAGSDDLHIPIYHYVITIFRKGKTGDITKERNDMMNKFAEGWYEFWHENTPWLEVTDNIFARVDEIESDFDILACQFVGAISRITPKRRVLHESAKS